MTTDVGPMFEGRRVHHHHQQQQQQQQQQHGYIKQRVHTPSSRPPQFKQPPPPPESRRSDNMSHQRRRIVELEVALAASEWRLAHLSTSGPPGVADPSNTTTFSVRTSTTSLATIVDDQQLRCALEEAEKRADWLRGELKMVAACAAARVRELKHELAYTRKQEPQAIAAAAGASASRGGVDDGSAAARRGLSRASFSDVEEMDNKLNETSKMLKILRKKFFRVLRKQNQEEARCAKRSTGQLLQGKTWTIQQQRQPPSRQPEQQEPRQQQLQGWGDLVANKTDTHHQSVPIAPRERGTIHGSRRKKRATCSDKSKPKQAAPSTVSLTSQVDADPPEEIIDYDEWRWPSLCEGKIAASACEQR